MEKILPFRKRRRSSRWLKAETYHPAARSLPRGGKWMRWFPLVLVIVPLASVGGVFFWHSIKTVESSVAEPESANFGLCFGPVRSTCVVDGDTIWYRGEKIRIADVDTPEVSKPRCAREEALGRKATRRLQALLNEGPFTLQPNPDGRTEDKYGRSLMLITRGGESLGAVLVDEGLAEQWGGPRREWC